MAYYYVAPETRSHAFLLERRMKDEGIACEITYMPRAIMTGLCNMGVKFDQSQLPMAAGTIRRSGLPGCKMFKESIYPEQILYTEEPI